MDGVLAKWDSNTSSEGTKVKGYFLAREPEMIITELVNALIAIGSPVCILSAVWNEDCAKEKSIWLDKYINPNVNRIFVPYGTNKADYISGGRGNILIDDFTQNLKSWKESGNIPIKFYNGINGTKGTYIGSSINYKMTLGEILEIIANAKTKYYEKEAS